MIDEPEPKDTRKDEMNTVLQEAIEKLEKLKLSNP